MPNTDSKASHTQTQASKAFFRRCGHKNRRATPSFLYPFLPKTRCNAPNHLGWLCFKILLIYIQEISHPLRSSKMVRWSHAVWLHVTLLLAWAASQAHGQNSTVAICLNTCPTANNGVCEDGGPDSVSGGLCEYGTDCTDCGTRCKWVDSFKKKISCLSIRLFYALEISPCVCVFFVDLESLYFGILRFQRASETG